MCFCPYIFPLGLDCRIDKLLLPLVCTTKCIFWLSSSSGSLWLPLEYRSGESIFRHTDNVSQIAPSSLLFDICCQGLMRDRTICLVSYGVPPVNIQYPAKTVVLESENPLFLLLIPFPAFTAKEKGKENVGVEQPQFQFQEYFFALKTETTSSKRWR